MNPAYIDMLKCLNAAQADYLLVGGNPGGLAEMNKTIRVFRNGEEPNDYAWALKFSESERLKIATDLTRRAWRMSHNGEFPALDRLRVRLTRP